MLKVIIIMFSSFSALFSTTLQEAYNQSSSYEDYDKYVILNNETIYSG